MDAINLKRKRASSGPDIDHDGYPAGDGDPGIEDTKETKRFICPDCGKVFRDVKTHMITHKNRRPARCPVKSCGYHVKGFARKYDRDRHALTHYKGTMICCFCPGSGTSAEKSFHRSDTFKKHLITVHKVEQTLHNGGQGSRALVRNESRMVCYAPDTTGNCSTCSQSFSNAQDFHDHLDECVLQIIQNEDPAEAINADRLDEVENDVDVIQTLKKNHVYIPTQTMHSCEDKDAQGSENDEIPEPSGTGLLPTAKRSKMGVQKTLGTETNGRRRISRRNYPLSWGYDKGQVTLKRRIMSTFNGPRRLAKDDTMLSTEYEVRIKLSDGKSYVTDWDVQTMKRVEAFHSSIDEKKSPWAMYHSGNAPTTEEKQLLPQNSRASLPRATTLHQGGYFQ